MHGARNGRLRNRRQQKSLYDDDDDDAKLKITQHKKINEMNFLRTNSTINRVKFWTSPPRFYSPIRCVPSVQHFWWNNILIFKFSFYFVWNVECRAMFKALLLIIIKTPRRKRAKGDTFLLTKYELCI